MDESGRKIQEFYANFKLLDGHIDDQKTMEFWNKNRLMYEYTRQNQQDIIFTMYNLSMLLTELSKDYIIKFVAMPACFDWMFFKSYYEYAKRIDTRIKYDIGYKCICMSSEIDIYCKLNNISKYKLLKSFYRVDPSSEHDALYDAMVQGIQYINFLQLVNTSCK